MMQQQSSSPRRAPTGAGRRDGGRRDFGARPSRFRQPAGARPRVGAMQTPSAQIPGQPYQPMITPFFPEGSDRPPLKVYALGGLEEIGRNCTVFE
jgi:hypothetical protein